MAKAHFIQAPPLKRGHKGRTKRKSLPNPPRKMPAEEQFRASVFYYWWAYLRCHPAYLSACENGGKGKLAALYSDFGDIRGDDFWSWWKAHSHLFSEPPIPQVEAVNDLDSYRQKPNTILLEVPLDKRLRLRVAQVKRLLEANMEKRRYLMGESQAQYKVTGKPVIASLDTYLKAWQLKQKYPKLPYAAIYEAANGGELNVEAAMKPKRRSKKYAPDAGYKENVSKTQMGYRYVKYAEEIMANVVKGEFPKFTKTIRNKALNRSV